MVSPHLSVVIGFLLICRIVVAADPIKLAVWKIDDGATDDATAVTKVNSWRANYKLPPLTSLGKIWSDSLIDELVKKGDTANIKVKKTTLNTLGFSKQFEFKLGGLTAFFQNVKKADSDEVEFQKDALMSECPNDLNILGRAAFPTDDKLVSASLIKFTEGSKSFVDVLPTKDGKLADFNTDARALFLLPVVGLNMHCLNKKVECSVKEFTADHNDDANDVPTATGDDKTVKYELCLWFTAYDSMVKGETALADYLTGSVKGFLNKESLPSPPWVTGGAGLSTNPGRGLVAIYLFVFLSVYILV